MEKKSIPSIVSGFASHILTGIVILTMSSMASAQNEISATYSSGHIPTSYASYDPLCNGPLTTLEVALPAGESYQVTNIHVAYTMTAFGAGWMSDQQSKIRCVNTGIEESTVSGIGNSTGTYAYDRDATIANQLYAGETTLTFEMWAYRTWSEDVGCNTIENQVNNGTWTITVFYSDEVPIPNMGVNESNPTATLDVAGKIRISDDLNVPEPGMIRWNNAQQDFEGYNGSEWKSFSLSPNFSDEDNDTRILLEANPDEDIIRFEAAGEERMTILDIGNVGIGTTEPPNKLSILGSYTSSDPVLKSESTFSGNEHVHAVEGLALPAVGFGKGGYFTGGARGVQAFGQGGASPSTIIGVEATATGTAGIRVGLFGRAQGGATNWAGYFDDGNVYIKGRTGAGTLLPEARIHAQENSTITFPHLRLTETSANDYARIKFETLSDPGIFWDIAGRSDTSASESRLNFYYSNPGFTGDKMTITGEGNVGIGTSSPVSRLRVHGSTTSSAPVLSAGTNFLGNVHVRAIEGTSTPAIGYGIGGYFLGGQKGIESLGLGDSFTGQVFGVIGGSAGTAGTRIGLYGWATGGTTNWAGYFVQGNVYMVNELRIGFGAINGASGYKVAVDGKIIAEEVRVQLSGDWPDYVFHQDYPLMSLDQLRQEIAEHGHLPGIPSAIEIKAEGIELGDMQTRMMEKIEELSLYILHQDERLKFLEKQLSELQAKKY